MSSPDAPSRVDAGLCASCAHSKIVTSSRGSIFYLCQLSSTDASFPRYPALPVVSCRGYEAAADRRLLET